MLARFNDQTAPASLRADAVCIISKLCIGTTRTRPPSGRPTAS